jgi:hypothetical protein
VEGAIAFGKRAETKRCGSSSTAMTQYPALRRDGVRQFSRVSAEGEKRALCALSGELQAFRRVHAADHSGQSATISRRTRGWRRPDPRD